MDYVGRALDQARKKAQLAGVSVDFLFDDVTRLKLISGKFDLVLDIGCFHSLSGPEKIDYLTNLERLTGAGSSYLMYGFIPDADTEGPGIREPDLKAFEDNFILFNREEGTDRGQRRSVWLTYQRKPVE